MIIETYWKILEDANRQLALRFEKLKKARQWRSAIHNTSPDGVSQGIADTLHRRAASRRAADAF